MICYDARVDNERDVKLSFKYMILRIKLRMFPKERVILTYSTSYFLEQWIFGEGSDNVQAKTSAQ
jgi:hypothetical protein